jgi:transcription-repair coupling factor (superfamily II helicase)
VRGKEPVEWARPLPDLSVDRGAPEPLKKLQQHVASTPHRVLIVAESEGRRESLLELLRDHRSSRRASRRWPEFEAGDESSRSPRRRWPKASSGTSRPTASRSSSSPRPSSSPPRRPRAAAQAGAGQRRQRADQGPVELKVGDPVVHVNHGIGRYVGLMNIDLGDGASEFLHLEYADKATLYVPVAQLHLISRYTGVSPEEAPLHKLGSGQWDKAKRKAAEQVRDTPPSC